MDCMRLLGDILQFISTDRNLFEVEFQALRLGVEKPERIEHSNKKAPVCDLFTRTSRISRYFLNTMGRHSVPTHTGAVFK